MAQHIDNFLPTGGEPPDCPAKRLAQRTGNRVHLAENIIEFGDSLPRLPYHARRVALVHHHQSVVFPGQLHDPIHGCHVAIHREHPIRDNHPETLLLGLFQFLFKVVHIRVGIPVTFRLTEAHPINDRSMIERVGDNRVVTREKRIEESPVRVKARSIQDGIVGVEKFADRPFQLLMIILRTADKADRRHTVSPLVECPFRRVNQFRVIRQPQVVIRAKVKHFLSRLHLNLSPLRAYDYTLFFVKSRFLDGVQFRL